MYITLRSVLFLILSFLLISCSKQNPEVINGDENIYISLEDRVFITPKKYIDNPSRSVPQKLIFNDNEGMIIYYYWPTLEGLNDYDDQPRFGRINHSVVQMGWRLLKNVPVSTAQVYKNVNRINLKFLDSSECTWKGITECRYSNDGKLATWIGLKKELGYFWIRCPANENKEVLKDEICNFSVDYDYKGLYIEGFIGSKYILDNDNFPEILDQNKRFLDQWEAAK